MYREKPCPHCKKLLTPIYPNHQFHARCWREWRKKYQRDYQRKYQRKIREELKRDLENYEA